MNLVLLNIRHLLEVEWQIFFFSHNISFSLINGEFWLFPNSHQKMIPTGTGSKLKEHNQK